MKKLWSKGYKRIAAVVLALYIVFSSFNMVAFTATAEQEVYTISCSVQIKGEKINLEDAEVKIYKRVNDKREEIAKTNNGYALEAGENYIYEAAGMQFSKVEGTFTAGSVKKGIEINIPLDKLNIAMESQECYEREKLSMVKADDWNLDWIWKSNKPEVVEVDASGELRAVCPGKATITKTSMLNPEIKASTTVTVKPLVNCKLEFVLDKGTNNEQSLEKLSVTLKLEEEEVKQEASGNYFLIPERKYQYVIADTGIKEENKTGTFTSPAYKEGQQLIQIGIGLIEPTFTVDGMDVEGIDKLKKDNDIELICTNYNALYGKEDWTYTTNERNSEQKLKKSQSVYCTGDNICIEYNYNKYKKTLCSVASFEEYQIDAYYNLNEKTEILIDSDKVNFKIKDKTGAVEKKAMKANTDYEIIASAAGFEDAMDSIKTLSYKQNVRIALEKAIPPKLTAQEITGYCGQTISLENIDIDVRDCYSGSGWNWDWECIKKGDSNKKLQVNGNSVDLENAEEGEYELRYGIGDVRSNEAVTLKVKRLKLGIDWDKFPEQKKVYDKTQKFVIELPISDQAIKFTELSSAVKTDYNVSQNDKLIITCDVDSAEVGEYARVSNCRVRLETENNGKYDISLISHELESGKDIGSGKLKIEQLVRTISNPLFSLQYRTNKIHPLYSSYNIFGNEKVSEEEIYKKMGEAGLKTLGDFQYCTFSGVSKENDKTCYIETKNYKIIFSNLKADDSAGDCLFRYEVVPEILQNQGIPNEISILQGKIARKNKDWCNDEKMKAQIRSDSIYNGSNAYNAVTFYELTQINNLDEIVPENYRKDKVKRGKCSLDVADIKKETYYEMLFTQEDKGFQYSTVAAFIRIVPEEQFNKDIESYPTELEDTEINGMYPVITLFVDTTPPKVSFDDKALNKEENSDNKVKIESVFKKQVDFSIENQGFDVESIKYCISSVDKENFTIADIDKTNLKPLIVNNVNHYTINCPDEEGDYVVYIKTKNEGGIEGEYYSNGFHVDTTPPRIMSGFASGEQDLTDAVKEKQEVYVNQSVKAEFELKEKHLNPERITVIVEAKDKNGKELTDKKEYTEKIQEKVKEALKNTQKAECEFEENASYTVTITAVDKAELSTTNTYHFTVDNEKPDKGSVLAEGKFYTIKSNSEKKEGRIELLLETLVGPWINKKVEDAIHTVFSKEEITVTLDGDDRLSPVSIYYYIANRGMKEEELNAIEEENWTEYTPSENKKLVIQINRKEIVYEKVVDRVGNVSYFCSEGMITDNRAPGIRVLFDKEANKNNFYQKDVPFSAVIEDKVTDGVMESSGLQYAAYRIEKEGKLVDSKVVYDAQNQKDVNKKDCTIKGAIINAEKLNSNDVTLYVTAVDNAGNKREVKKKLMIDTVKPEISVTYNTLGEKYYNQKRTATIAIKERNLDIKDVKISVKGTNGSKAAIGKWTHTSDIGESDDAVYTCKVTFSEDDDYEFSVSCADKAGNQAKKNFSDRFTIDMTKPVIAVSYNGEAPEQNAYYNEPITATITITEHNFNADKADIRMHKGLTGTDSRVQRISGFSSKGDVHTATVQFGEDGIYGLDITYTDKAGNEAENFHGNSFTVDLTEPEVRIINVEDKSANKAEVQPVILCTDKNYDADKVFVEVKGANGGEIDLKRIGYTVTDVAEGQQFALDFPKLEEMDDVYTLTAGIEDKAGNKKESSIEFSVNRYGSVYTLGAETGEWLTNGECAYIKEGKQLVIIETNVNEVVERNISYTAGGMDAAVVTVKGLNDCSAKEQEAGTYYEVSQINTGNQWHQYRYEVNPENFKEEGRYTLQIDSVDKAGNHTSNVSSRHSDSKLGIQFAIDQTAPSVVISGAENGAIYNENEHTVLLDVQDNLAMDYITVYLNDKEYDTYTAEDIKKAENGLIPVLIEQSLSRQRLQVKAIDMAGNILGENAEEIYDKAFNDFRILVTRNVFVRFFHTTWLLILTTLMISCGIGGTVFIIRRKKNKPR